MCNFSCFFIQFIESFLCALCSAVETILLAFHFGYCIFFFFFLFLVIVFLSSKIFIRFIFISFISLMILSRLFVASVSVIVATFLSSQLPNLCQCLLSIDCLFSLSLRCPWFLMDEF